jgi:serine/threonine protein kinase
MKAFERELSVFSAARQLPAAERAAYLDQTCAGDPALRQRVEELLRAGEDAEGFLQEPAPGAQRPVGSPAPATLVLNAAAPGEKAGDRIGHYKLSQQIGEGGCGLVYMAEQEEPVRRRVALKVIKLGMDTKQVIARFEAERQALAMMDHPNIAKVLDAGATGSPLSSDGRGVRGEGSLSAGRPYFVMELVRGIKITEYCDEHNLSTKERLELFIQVCHAVQHAHQKGVIHRDLKPSNILVASNDGVPVPKVIDFGIAKATQGRLTDQTLFTAFEQFIGTPAYMSPEQAALTMQDVDTRTDIYSLGVLLYELLTGKTPFDAQELLASGLDAMRRTIREQEPVRPSTKLSTMLLAADMSRRKPTTGLAVPSESEIGAESRQRLRLREQIKILRGDLDWIVMKCLEKDRVRRYETANGLAGDVARYLKSEPVAARPPSRMYRLQKLARRNKLAFVAASAIAAAVVAGLGISTWMFIRERAAHSLAITAEEEQFQLREQAEEARAQEAGLRADAESARSNEASLRQQAESARTNEVALRQQAEMAQRIAQAEAAQLGETLRQLGKFDEAERFIRYALAMQRKSGSNETPEFAASLSNLANVLLAQEKNPAEAESACREALALRRKLLGNDHRDVATSLERLGTALSRQGNYAEAEAADSEAVAIDKKLFGADDMDVSRSLLSLAGVLQAEGKIEDAEARYVETLAVARRLLGDEHPYVHSVLNILAQMLLDNGKAADAEPVARECLAIRQKKMPDEWLTFSTQSLLGGILVAEKKYDEAEPLLLSSYESMTKRTNDPDASQRVLETAVQRLAQLYEATGQPDKAVIWRKSLDGR